MHCVRHMVLMETLCFVVESIAFQLIIHILKTTRVLVCGQSIIHNYYHFLEGGLLCVENSFV